MSEERWITCEEIVELVTDLLEGALDEDLARRVQHHLDLCPACEEYVEQFRTTMATLGRVPSETLSDTARETLLDAFRTFHR